MTKIPIYLITNRHLVSSEKYFNTIKEAGKHKNIKIILREKDLNNKEYEELYYKVKKIAPSTEIIINSKIDIFQKIEEKTIQVSFNDFKKNNNIIGKVGVSVHSLEEAIYADENGADFILVSHIFATKCKEGLKPKGVDYIKEVKAKVSCKVVALGGINTENYNEVIKAGADGIAIMSLLFESKNIHETIKKINM